MIFHHLWEKVFVVFGIPRVIISDRDRIFKTEKWAKKMEDIGAVQVLSTAHHQQTGKPKGRFKKYRHSVSTTNRKTGRQLSNTQLTTDKVILSHLEQKE